MRSLDYGSYQSGEAYASGSYCWRLNHVSLSASSEEAITMWNIESSPSLGTILSQNTLFNYNFEILSPGPPDPKPLKPEAAAFLATGRTVVISLLGSRVQGLRSGNHAIKRLIPMRVL